MSDRPTPKGSWLIVALLFLFMLINFVDKAVIGLAAVPMMKELNLSPSQFGLVGSSFFLLFSLSAVVTGFIVNRVQTRWVLLVMSLAWALTQFPMVGTVGFATVLACRIALGAGEGPAYPVALHATYKWFPNELRTLPTAIVSQGAGVGLMVALPMLNWVIINYSWHWAFAALGIVGLAWTGAWLLLGREGPIVGSAAPTATATPDRVSYARLLCSPTVLSSWCAFFGAYWGLSLAISWQAAFLIKGLGFAQGSVGLLSALPPGISVVVVIAAGWYSQHLLARGVSSRMARGVFGGACVGLGGIALLIMPQMPTIPLKIAMTTIGISLPSVIYVFSHAVVSEVTPVAQRGALLSIGNAVGTSAGLLAPYIMGSVIETAATPLDGFYTGYVICGIIMLIGGIIGMALMHPEREAARWAPELPRQAAIRSA
ncbi:MFS transporter [Bradyrhizobium erythrophlei]|uniref:Sugar phosphate permease n=1 Tax=Bradyrhizobium erythrophlei TaxID=1437360 RepID=A0A1M5LRT1_9BRAD|nr:MFS transporter [Bradyrhizobium erythrophlei]SHG67600.1 Sugar phosphate permease [Bradyrhizobium erythrophlei]